MARSQGNNRAPTRQKSGMGWLIIAAILGGLLAVLVFNAEGMRTDMGKPDKPADGEPPVVTENASGSAATRTPDLAARDIGTKAETSQAKREVQTEQVTKAPQVEQGPTDQKRGDEILAEAQQSYRQFQWDDARLQARKILDLDVTPATTVRAKDILRGADALEDMFAKLDTKDGLRRGWDTHPLSVMINSNGVDSQVVPVKSLGDQSVPETDDPVGWLEGQLAATGRIAVLLTSGAGTELKRHEVAGIRPADLDAIIDEKQREFDTKVTKVQQGAFAQDPLMWYEAAKYAFRNRLDEQVTAMLDQALEFNPFLADAIREDKAQEIYFKMVSLIQKGNKAGSAIWYKQISDYYKETTVYAQATAYYRGNLAAVATAKRKAKEEKMAKLQKIKEERVKRAEALQGAAEAKRVAREAIVVEEEPEAPVTGDAAVAHAAYDDGMEIYTQAINMPVTDERDNMYAKAQKFFDKAMRLYEQLGMTDDMVKANQKRYACIKYRRNF